MHNTELHGQNNTGNTQKEDLESLKDRISKDPWNQQLYTEAIHLSLTQNDTTTSDQLKKQFLTHCIADDNFWLAYIEEKKASSTTEDVIGIYEFAVKNEPSAYIWLSYLRFVSENAHTLSDYERLRALFESSLEALGLHALDGPQIWFEYRHFEQELLQKVPKEEYESQLDRVRSLFYRQLELPLAGLPDVLDEYLVWEAELPAEYKRPTTEGENAHKRGFDAWELRKFFELKIQSDFHEMMSRDNMNSLWNDYIDFELKCGDMARIMMVYHRALDDLGYERDDLWINYANYALQTSYAKSLCICERACRHMPRSLNIWINYFLVVSSKSENVRDIIELLEKSTSAVQDVDNRISLHITAADCVRRIDIKDAENCRYILSKCHSDLEPDYSSRAVYRLLTYWSKYELKLLSFNLASEYVEVVGKLLQRFKNDPFCWLYVIDTVKGLNPENSNTSKVVSHIYRGFSSLVDFNSESEPTSLHTLIIWLYELALTVVNVNDLAEDYIDYVQSSGVVEDIKRAHKVVATHSTPTSRPDTTTRASTLSLNTLVKRVRRRKAMETFSETSSDSGSYSSWAKRPCNFPSGMRSPSLSLKESEMFIRSPKLSHKDLDSKSPKLGYKDLGYRDLGSKEGDGKQGRITLRDLETVTRATWDGFESFDPSIAPAVPPNAPMPPPCSPVLSRITSRLSNSGSCSPDLTPELRFTKGSSAPPPLILSSDLTNLSGSDPSAKLSDSITHSEYKLNFSTADSESIPERLSSDTDSQTDRFESPIIKSRKDFTNFRPDLNTDPPAWNTPLDLDTSVTGGHYLLSRKECVMNWLSGGSENSTVFVSGFDASQLPHLEEFFAKQPGFVELRQARNKRCCYVEFSTTDQARVAIEESKDHFKDYPTPSVQSSRPPKPLFEDQVIFAKILNHTEGDPRATLKDFFSYHGFNTKEIRCTKSTATRGDGPGETHKRTEATPTKSDDKGPEKHEKLGYYIEFDFENAARTVMYKFINEFGWPTTTNHKGLKFHLLPSIPIISHSKNKQSEEPVPDEGDKRNELYICNLNYNTHEPRLRSFLEENAGPVKSLTICKDAQGRSKGYAFVEFDQEDAYPKLLAHSLVLDGRKLYVSRSKSHSNPHSKVPLKAPQGTGPEESASAAAKTKAKKRFKDYKNKLVTTYSKLKKKIKLN